jgi:hypothetical protein
LVGGRQENDRRSRGGALAGGAGVVDGLDFNCRKPRPLKPAPPGNCSAVLAVGRRSRTGQPLLLKIRDEAPYLQIMFRRAIQGRHTVLGGANVGNLGLAHFLNSAGLAGAESDRSLPDGAYRYDAKANSLKAVVKGDLRKQTGMQPWRKEPSGHGDTDQKARHRGSSRHSSETH